MLHISFIVSSIKKQLYHLKDLLNRSSFQLIGKKQTMVVLLWAYHAPALPLSLPKAWLPNLHICIRS